MPKWVLALALALAGCATTESVETVRDTTAPQTGLLLEVDVWDNQADFAKTRAFYESLGLKVTQSIHENGPFSIHELDIVSGANTVRITFVPHAPPFASWDTQPKIHAGYEEPEYPEFRPTWLISVTPARFEELRTMQGAHVYRLEGREYIGLQDPAGLKVRIQGQ